MYIEIIFYYFIIIALAIEPIFLYASIFIFRHVHFVESEDFQPKVMRLPMLNPAHVLHVKDASRDSNKFTTL